MAYSPENNPYIPGDPYSYDLKWIITQLKKAISLYDPLNSKFESLEAYVNDYFNNLDISAEVSAKLEEMAEDGRLTSLITGCITPQMYGAKADGVTDDLSALNKMMQEYDGGLIYFPAGTYYISDSWNIWKSNTIILFNKNATLRMDITGGSTASSSGGHMLGIYYPGNNLADQSNWNLVENVTIIGGKFDVTSTGTNENAIGIAQHVKNVKIIGAEITRANRKGITAQYDVDGLVIDNCVIDNTNICGISLESNMSQIDDQTAYVQNVLVRNTKITNSGSRDLVATEIQNLTIDNCNIKSETLLTQGAFTANSIYIYNSTGIIKNTKVRANAHGLLSSSNTDFLIRDCDILSTDAQAVTTYLSDLDIDGGIYECTATGDNINAIDNYDERTVSTSKRNFSIKNAVIKSANFAIRCYRSGLLVIKGCRLSTSAAQKATLQIETTDHCIVTDNYITGAYVGILIAAPGEAFSIIGNIIVVTSYGLYISSIQTAELRPMLIGNRIISNAPISGTTPPINIGVYNSTVYPS